ncbi:MAG: HAMP domain-containing histidine kinase [Bacteriovoracaceae bacterium]|nr:HAMP domain-containing histidine kinase [Bacteriovoracaceae bacterium]
MKRISKEIYVLVYVSILISPFFYYKAQIDLDRNIKGAVSELKEKIKQTDLILDFMTELPFVSNSIDFSSYDQIDKLIETRMHSDEMLDEFHILNSSFVPIYSKKMNYKLSNLEFIEKIREYDKKTLKPFYFLGSSLFILKKIKRSNLDDDFYIMAKLFIDNYFINRLAQDGIYLKKPIYFNDVVAQNTADFSMLAKNISKDAQLYRYLMDNLAFLIMVIIFMFSSCLIFIRLFITPFRKIISYIKQLSSANMHFDTMDELPRIFRPYLKIIVEANSTIVKAQKTERELENQKLHYKIAQQVAHDIRSPLVVIKTLKHELDILPEKIRRILLMSINRIEEITLNLLKKNERINADSTPLTEELLTLIENVLIEKRIEYRNNDMVNITLIRNCDDFGFFANVRKGYFKRIISNLINNSIEACGDKNCSIVITLKKQHNNHILILKDNGPGIPSEVLEKLFTNGFSTKVKGNGLGLFSAREELEKCSGTIVIDSLNSNGTEVTIKLPSVDKPSFFTDSLTLTNYEKVIILDDDISIHEMFRKLFAGAAQKVEYFDSIKSFESTYKKLSSNILLLIDYEFVGEVVNGIDVIKKIQHQKNSHLVTARNEEDDILTQCKNEGIKILPKNLIVHVPIKL